MKLALEFMRSSLRRPVSIDDLVRHCGVPERTLNEHFRAFLGMAPLRYQRRLRLAAARKALLGGASDISVTEVASRYAFNHFGRFSSQYGEAFGEPPSATLRRARSASQSEEGGSQDKDRPDSRRPLPNRATTSIAILPCQIAKNDPAFNWLAESLVDATAVSLGALHRIAVKVPPYRQAGYRDPRRLARELNARYLLTGRIEQAGGRLRVILRVVDSTTWQQVWGDSFEGKHDEIAELQDRVADGVSRAILSRIRGAEIDRAQRTVPENLDAYGLAMRALPLVFDSRPQSANRALELLERALEIDPDYSLSPALAAWCHGQLVMYNGTRSPSDEKARAVRLLRRVAVFEDDDDPLALAARCAVHTMTKEFDLADALVTRALALDPTFGWAWGRSAWLHSYRGNSDTAIEHFSRAISLDSRSGSRANNFAGIGSAHFHAGRYEAAAFWLQRALREQPDMWWPNRSLCVSYARLGSRQKALESLNALRRHSPDLTVSRVLAAVPFKQSYLSRLGEGLRDLGLPL